MAHRPSLLDLSSDELALITSFLDPDAVYPFALTARALRAAQRATGRPLATTVSSVTERGGTAVRWAVNHGGLPLTPRSCLVAAREGHLPGLIALRELECAWDETTLIAAAVGGHVPVLSYAFMKGAPVDKDLTGWAASHGQTESLRWAHRSGLLDRSSNAVYLASKGGHLEALTYLHECGARVDASASEAAARHGHLHVLRYLRGAELPWSRWGCIVAAAQTGQLPILQWIHRESGGLWRPNSPAFLPLMVALGYEQHHVAAWLQSLVANGGDVQAPA